jgi:hypothetical protein
VASRRRPARAPSFGPNPAVASARPALPARRGLTAWGGGLDELLDFATRRLPKPRLTSPWPVRPGTYEGLGERIVVTEEEGALVMRIKFVDLPGELELQPLQPPPPVKLRPIDRERFTVQAPGAGDVAVFLEFERGSRVTCSYPGGPPAEGHAGLQHRQPAGPPVVARGPSKRPDGRFDKATVVPG